MTPRRRSIGVILAGGTGTRLGLSIPKQLLTIAGKPVLEHTVGIFQQAASIDEILILMHPDHLAAAEQIAARYPKVSRVVAAGRTRNDSTSAALAALAESADPDAKVLFHDAVRPLLETRILDDLVTALDQHDAVDVAIRSADTIIEVDDENTISAIPDRSRLRRGQTPQGFRLSTIQDAYERAWQDPDFMATDDCSVVLKYLPDIPIAVVDGSEQNVKITEPIDVLIASQLFQIGSHTAPPSVSVDEYHQRLAGKVLVVLDGSTGVGASDDVVDLARSFGATVRCYSRSQTDLDVSDADDIAKALEQVHIEHGQIDYLVLITGPLACGPVAEASTDELVQDVQVNYLAPVLTARLAHQYLKASGGQLVFFTPSSDPRGRTDDSVYSSAKAAVVNLAQALAGQWLDEGIRVNVINPARSDIPIRTGVSGEGLDGSPLSARAVAQATLDVLLSPLTGTVIEVRKHPDREVGSRSELAARITETLAAVGGDSAV